MKLRLLSVILALVASLSATTLTGTFKSANGTRVNGSLTLVLSYPTIDTSVSPAQSVSQEPVKYTIANGVIVGLNTIIGNDVMQPSRTVYFGILRNTAGQAIRYGNYYVSGTTYDIGGAIPTAVTTQNVSFAGNIATDSSLNSFTNKTYNVEGSGNVFTSVERNWYPAAICQNVTAIGNWDHPTTNVPTPTCFGPGNPKLGALNFSNSGLQTATIPDILLSQDMTPATLVDIKLWWFSAFTSGTVTWAIDIACYSAGGSTAVGAGTYTAFLTGSAVAPPGSASVPAVRNVSGLTLPIGCFSGAGALASFKVKRTDTDATNTAASIIGLEIAYRRTQ